MADKVIRELERELAADPSNAELRKRWIMAKNRVGEAKLATYYKIKRKGKFYSKDSYSNAWQKTGTRFSSKVEAIKALIKPRSRRLNTDKDTDGAVIICYHTYTVAEESSMNLAEERSAAALEEIKLKKKDLEERAKLEKYRLDEQERLLLNRLQKERSALLKKEQKLLRKAAKK